MAKFTVTLTDPAQLAAMTAARLRHNSRLPKDAMPFFSDNEYIQFMVEKAADRYAKEFSELEQPAPSETGAPTDDLESQLAARLAAELMRGEEPDPE
jgi:hypothetical protein